jgi:hypothetical protein
LEEQLRIEQLGNSEVQELWGAICHHQNVSWLQVSVNDQVLMSVLNRRADLAEDLEPR